MPINIRLISYATICNVNIGEQRLRIQNRHPERLSLGRFPTLNSILIIFTNAIVCTLACKNNFNLVCRSHCSSTNVNSIRRTTSTPNTKCLTSGSADLLDLAIGYADISSIDGTLNEAET